MKDKLNVKLIKKKFDEFANLRNWKQFHNPKNLTMALSVEAAELLEIFQWLTPKESEKIEENHELFKDVKREIADILLYLIRISDLLNIDLEEAVLKKMDENEKKYPVSKSKGNAKKYTKL